MKVLHIVPTYAPAYGYGGPIRSVHFLNKWLVKNGVEVTVYTTNLDKTGVLNVPLCERVDMDGVAVHYFPVSKLLRSWSYSGELHKALAGKTGSFDIVHITSVFLAASALGARYAKKNNIPYVISPRGSLITDLVSKKSRLKKTLYIKYIEKRNIEGAAALHFTSQVEEEDYNRSGLPLKSGFVIPNSFDEEEFLKYDNAERGAFRKSLGIPADVKVVLILGRITWKKGIDLLIRSISRINSVGRPAVLVIAGNDDGFEAQARRLTHEIGVEDRVVFCGSLAGKRRVEAYKDADVFALPSLSENFGQVILEALYEGLPVVVTKETAASEAFKSAKYVLRAERNESDITQKIMLALSDDGIRQSAKNEGRLAIINMYAPGLIAQRMLAEYRKILSGELSGNKSNL